MASDAGDESGGSTSAGSTNSSSTTSDPGPGSNTLGQTVTSGPEPTVTSDASTDGPTGDESSTSTSTGEPPPFCGDGTVDEGEECDDSNAIATDDCTSMCTIPTCGDGFVWEGHEECDDGDDDVHDDCTGDCVAAFCGDGIIHAGVEECDDVNDETGDGCMPGCVAENAHVYLMAFRDDEGGIYRYSVDDDAWDTIPNAGWLSSPGLGLASDGDSLYWWDHGLGLFQYVLATSTIEYIGYPPLGTPGNSAAPFELFYAEGRLYLIGSSPEEGEGTYIYLVEDGEWSWFQVDANAGWGGGWDPVARELYLGLYDDMGFFVIDTTSNAVVRSFEVGPGSDWYTGTFVGGSYYSRLDDGAIQKLDAYDGTQQDTGVVPTSQYTGRAVANLATGKIYLSGFNPWGAGEQYLDHFEVYDTIDGSLTTLASPPIVVWTSSPTFGPMTLIHPGD
jgi:cysteine-rich repeat protein